MINKLNIFFNIITAISITVVGISMYNNKPQKLNYKYMKSLSNEEYREYINDYEKQFKKQFKK